MIIKFGMIMLKVVLFTCLFLLFIIRNIIRCEHEF